ncbi:hypothetical protein SISSUDRAFT_1122382 [Sistotremastrum suecicum HHB10207 ss-3]|uniref:Transcription factor IIIC putative zinc-finger domain-containing protein n=1 Tax=Sistotremastrum suecicum HHB10207 ss-3 TaxID=1314776 RepID=A0A165ZES6_9AGAM|nr:hypothetical protein SISSUDRAFT_1122382 [Sistotremastrum suecicum HHB10207 ss-3]
MAKGGDGDQNIPIISLLNFLAPSIPPSSKPLRWSDDGQALVLTRDVLHILTPTPGVMFDLSSAVGPPKKMVSCLSDRPISWFRTSIEVDKAPQHNWATETSHQGAFSAGLHALSWRAFCCSPTWVDADGGYVICMLNSNSEVSLWAPLRNFLKGEWVKCQDVTALIKEQEIPYSIPALDKDGDRRKGIPVMNAQTTCLDWSSQPMYETPAYPVVDSSLLALGNRLGCVHLLRYTLDRTVEWTRSLQISSEWISHLAWSPWRQMDPTSCDAFLAYADSSGKVGLVHVKQQLHTESSAPSSFVTNTHILDLDSHVCSADRRRVAFLTWVQVSEDIAVLVYTKVKYVYLFLPGSQDSSHSLEWSDLRSIKLEAILSYPSTSALPPVIGTSYIVEDDVLLVSLFDGTIHTIRNLRSNPVLHSTAGNRPDAMDVDSDPHLNALSSSTLSARFREVFHTLESTSAETLTECGLAGLMGYDSFGTLMWLQEPYDPKPMTYKMTSQRLTSLVVSTLPPVTVDKTDIATIMHRTFQIFPSMLTRSPIECLRPLLTRLSPSNILDSWDTIISLLSQTALEAPPDRLLPLDVAVDARSVFRLSLRRALLSDQYLYRLRMWCIFSTYCQTVFKGNEHKDLEPLLDSILIRIRQRTLDIILDHIIGIVPLLQATDLAFVRRILKTCEAPGLAPELKRTADDLKKTLSSITAAPLSAFHEDVCPACASSVETPVFDSAVCAQGHTWKRCIVTSYLLATTQVRTCISCCRKAYLPPRLHRNSSLKENLEGCWIMTEMLEAIQRCLYCGSRFVQIL